MALVSVMCVMGVTGQYTKHSTDNSMQTSRLQAVCVRQR